MELLPEVVEIKSVKTLRIWVGTRAPRLTDWPSRGLVFAIVGPESAFPLNHLHIFESFAKGKVARGSLNFCLQV